MGRAAALDLASRADMMTGTQIIAREADVPAWKETAVYAVDHIGFPVQDNGQVYKILQAHTPAYNPGSRPADLPAVYSIQHTTDPQKAKPYVAPHGVSGMYMTSECCTDPQMPDPTAVYRSLVDNGIYAPSEYIQNWEEVVLEEVTV